MARFHLDNFGCRANQAEGAALAAALEAGGHAAAPAGEADWLVLNTCTVTAAADAAARRAIRALHRRYPRARIAVTGCYAQRAPAELAALPGVAAVAGLGAAAGVAAALLPAETLAPGPKVASLRALAPEGEAERARPVVKVQEGCDRRCSFCVLPAVRGASRSRPLGAVLEEVAALAAAGRGEIVLSGINLGQWGRDLGCGLGLAGLVRAVLEQTPVERLRLSSVEPADWTPALTALLGPRLARHAHLPLQSGSDAVLCRMRRRYRARDYAARVAAIHAAAPLAAIGADVLAGFPGESESEFEATLALIEALPLAYRHVFPFSPRPGTEAARRLARGEWRAVPAALAAARAERLRAAGERKRAAFLGALAGRTLPAVALLPEPGGRAWALTDNYARVALAAPAPPGRLLQVEVTAAAGGHLEGRAAA
jgi:threonylcarbamoyladenosine tRNA methylthiotransferase MtaB